MSNLKKKDIQTIEDIQTLERLSDDELEQVVGGYHYDVQLEYSGVFTDSRFDLDAVVDIGLST